MGAYLSEPVTDTVSSDASNEGVTFGASSMQGWRVSQEDAHTCILDFDKDSSLFAVFDGHGGADVAIYSSKNLPQLLKQLPAYKEDKIAEALEEAFLKFDHSLTTPEVIKELKALAGNLEDDDDEDPNETALLHEEATMPIEDIIARYGTIEQNIVARCGTTEQKEKRANSLPSHMKVEMAAKDKPLSPYLRAKQNNLDANKGECSSSSAKGGDAVCEPSCSSSFVSNGEHRDSSKGDECESVSSSAEAKNKKLDYENDNNNVSSSRGDQHISDYVSEAKQPIEPNSDSIPSSSSLENNDVKTLDVNKKEKEDEESGVSTSSEVKRSDKSADEDSKEDCPTSTDKSSAETPSCSKGKGKQKKTTQKIVEIEEEVSYNSKPIYEAFLRDCEIETDSDSEESDDDTEDFKAKVADSDSDEDEADDSSGDDDEDDDDDDDDCDEDEIKSKKIRFEKRLFMSPTCEYEEPGKDSGCTAVLALLRGNKLYVANAGDSRCVLCRNGKAIDMSIDHKPEDESERRRIEKAGGEVTSDGRVNGGLNLSRAIGDHSYKDNPRVSLKEQMISASPDVKDITLIPGEDKFMVLACDGIWNSMTSQQVVDFVSERIDKVDKLSKICEELFNTCLSVDTMGDGTGCDNMTCVIVRLDSFGKRKRKERDDECDESVNEGNTDGKRQKTEEPQMSNTI